MKHNWINYSRACALWDQNQEVAALALVSDDPRLVAKLKRRDESGIPGQVRFSQARNEIVQSQFKGIPHPPKVEHVCAGCGSHWMGPDTEEAAECIVCSDAL